MIKKNRTISVLYKIILKHTSLKGVIFTLITLFAFQVTAISQSGNLVPLEYNSEQLVKMAVQGEIADTRMSYPPYRIGADGELKVVPGSRGITYNFRTGDSAVNLAGDHVEPAVSLSHPNGRQTPECRGLNFLATIGNEVRVITGDAKGEKGIVIGKHSDDRVMVDFKDPEVLYRLTLNDRMQIMAYGLGMELTNIEGVEALNISPALIEALTKAGMGVTKDGNLRIDVAKKVPAKIMGSGLGRRHSHLGDYDIQMFDEEVVEKYGLSELRFGDIVAIINADVTYGRTYKTGAITIGVISHSTSINAGHGPGVTTIFTSTEGKIEPVINPGANLKYLLFE